MSKLEQFDRRCQRLAWGAGFILIGSLSLIPGDQSAEAVLGCGVILILLNLTRSLSHIPMNGFTLALGAAGFVAGTLALFRSSLGLHFEIELLPIILIAVGLYFLWPRPRKQESSST